MHFCKHLLACLLLLLPLASAAATVGERRQLQPGIWWDASRPGHGFELQQLGDQLFVLWYTYDASGAPIWYAAQAPIGNSGTVRADLLRHHWQHGRIDRSAVVGTLELSWSSRERARVQWTVGGRSGSWDLQPFEVAGVLPEVNHSGLWYQPQRPGYGLSLMEQGTALIGALFFYDPDGEPTWLFGAAADGDRDVPLQGYRGPCPGCSGVISADGRTARMALETGDEQELGLSLEQPRGLAGEWQLQDQALAQLSPAFSARAADWQLAHFESDAALKQWLEKANSERQLPSGSQIDFSAAPPSRAFAPTNVQEAGVDEADLVKTDGRHVYTFAVDGAGNAGAALRIVEIGDNGPRSLPPAPLAGLGTGALQNPGLYLSDTRLVALASSTPTAHYSQPAVWTDLYAWRDGSTRVEILDRTDPAAPRSLWQARLDGHLVASRRIGDQLYLVQRAALPLDAVIAQPADAAQREHNSAVFEATPLARMLPQASWNGQPAVPLVSATRTFLPPTGTAAQQPEFVMVTRIDLQDPDDRETLAVLGRAAAVYVSSSHLYLASSRYEYLPDGFAGFVLPGFSKTDIHQIALGAQGLRVVGSGVVEGYLDRDPDRAPLRFAERAGHLNVVTVSPGMWGALGQNRLSVLAPSTVQPGLLATRAVLPNKQRPQPLGKPGEMLYATRFVDDRLYAVTFQRTDPLYHVDLSRPDDPYIRGALEIPGFSDYLHPLPNGLLLGLGLDARAAESGAFAWFQGLQLSLFDVNGDHPRELQRVLVGQRGSYSAALLNHHAFADLAIGNGRLLALPGRVHEANASTPANPPDHYTYPHAYSGLLRFVLTGSSAADARLQVLPPLTIARNDSLYNHADEAQRNGRPVLFEHGALYVDRGRYYWISSDGLQQSGPF